MAIETKVLSLAEQTAIEAIQADIIRLQNKLRAVLVEAGLDPNRKFSVASDGTVSERDVQD